MAALTGTQLSLAVMVLPLSPQVAVKDPWWIALFPFPFL